MKLKDYIHYYIGCPCIYYMADDDPEGYHMILGYDTIKNWLSNQEETDIKPILRRLADMTDEEAMHIGKLAFFDRDMKYPDTDYKVKKVGITIELPSAYSVSINNDWYEKELRIGFNTGNLWRVGNDAQERNYNQPEIFHYLLRQHFDLFNLIDNQLAIDSKTIK